ncbi:MAG: hypothetical protein CVU48_04920 [Candidatus Cloacimonetes bacterium HGW-Cloacimonetes-1]|jgi:cell division protein FtsB|nr:MAG: hypothetical protein CVU48_04920 [Candidatus Cloacimonetes bacterium HGW-Cloacimonetes-1]
MRAEVSKIKLISRYIFAGIIALILLWVFILSDNSFWNTWRLNKEMINMRKKVTELNARNDSLRTENEKLQTSLDAAEKAARERFGLVKPGEKVFRFVPANEPIEKK